jgi:hypothetical protein
MNMDRQNVVASFELKLNILELGMAFCVSERTVYNPSAIKEGLKRIRA